MATPPDVHATPSTGHSSSAVVGVVSRRQILRDLGASLTAVGFGGIAVEILTGCAPASTSENANPPTPPVDAVAMFPTTPVIVAGQPQRLPIALVGGASLLADDAMVEVTFYRDGERTAATTVRTHIAEHSHPQAETDHPHGDTLRYFPVTTEFPGPGIYDLSIAADGWIAPLAVQAFDRSEVSVLLPGEALPSRPTPTRADALDVDPLCTLADGPCQLHEASLDTPATHDGVTVVLVGSPGYCTNAFCGSMLRLLIDVAAERPELTAIHLEPYRHPGRTSDGNLTDVTASSAAEDFGMNYEPALFVASKGTITERFDAVCNRDELEAALDRAAKN